jgi:predicted dehydrogenase
MNNRFIAAGKRIGIIGLDTSHAIAFTASLNGPSAGDKYKGYKIVAAYPHGSADIKTSTDRIPKYTEDVKKAGVEITGSIKELLGKVDAVMLETNDGRPHLKQALEVIAAKKILFVDKPIANSIEDAKAIFDAARKNGVPVFSASALRFAKGAQEIINGKVGKVIGADVYSPAHLEKTHVDFYWYGIHGVEMLLSIMGPGCETVTRFHRENMDMVVGTWKDGRIGSFRGLRTAKLGYGGAAFGEAGIADISHEHSNDDILLRVIDFFKTGKAPVSEEETLEICAFIEAAQWSKNNGGQPARLSDIYKRINKK